MPSTLLDLLSNSIVLRHTAPYLPVSAILALGAASKAFRSLTLDSPDAFRYLDLSNLKNAVIDSDPIDPGGISWRAERMDEALTEDEFYSGPLLGIFHTLQQKHILSNVQTLVLDRLSVPAELVREIISEDRFNVRILSIREAKHLNERKLMQVLKYAVRPTRPEGTPKLKGLYVFGPADPAPSTVKPKTGSPALNPANTAASASRGAQIGAQWNHRSSDALDTTLANLHAADNWYQPRGRLIRKKPSPEWAETLQACEGIIYFDAVLCRGPRHDPEQAYIHRDEQAPATTPHPYSYLGPAVATVALGPQGCATCHSCPEGTAVFGVSPPQQLPLLSPPPLHTSTVRAAQNPSAMLDPDSTPALIARCEECVRGRWCERCSKWWDEPCYSGTGTTARTEFEQHQWIARVLGGQELFQSKDIKVIGVRRECFGCGPTCAECKSLYIRACGRCRNEYCVVDNDGSSATRCDWCNHTSRRTVELY